MTRTDAKTDLPTFVVELRPTGPIGPKPTEADVYRNLRLVLKRLLRAHGFRCTRLETTVSKPTEQRQ